jgi:hypothetical protein
MLISDAHTEIANEKDELVRRLQDSLLTEQKQRRKAELRGDEQAAMARQVSAKLVESEEYTRKLKNDIIGYERRVALLEAYKVKADEDAEMAEHERRTLIKREQQRRSTLGSLRKDLGCYQTLLKFIAVIPHLISSIPTFVWVGHLTDIQSIGSFICERFTIA